MISTFFHIKSLVRCGMATLLALVLFFLGPGCDGNGSSGTAKEQDTINIELVQKEMGHIKEVGEKLKKSEEDLQSALDDLDEDSLTME